MKANTVILEEESTFNFVEYNPRRRMRGVGAARFQILVGGKPDTWIWCDESDIKQNIKDWGSNDAFTKALEHYKNNSAFMGEWVK